ncbi:D-3-phosphoglycerate dehydrogenase, partial [Striga asiatica]
MTQSSSLAQLGYSSRHSSARCRPVATPSRAESSWTRRPMTVAHRSSQTGDGPRLEIPLEVPRIQEGDAHQEARPGEQPQLPPGERRRLGGVVVGALVDPDDLDFLGGIVGPLLLFFVVIARIEQSAVLLRAVLRHFRYYIIALFIVKSQIRTNPVLYKNF